ncbi:MAG: LytTR family DNA-binding domain-containing protein [Deltaproteobacteria bacterium]|nr:LytTR family DNA-binding domain-containing protein [Deltaproteobacteria bacterium]
MTEIRAIIADDEALLRQFLRARLSEVWPELIISGEAQNGEQALDLIERHHPHIAFLDIRMPGLTGMEVADKIAGACRVVFVTAYDAYAVEAFDKEAVDYLLKPVSNERLQKTVIRLKEGLETGAAVPVETLRRLMIRISDEGGSRRLRYVRIHEGDGVRLVPVDEVIYFKAQDKYTLVITQDGESLIRKSIRELAGELDPERFWQIHRGTIVNVGSIDRVSRSLTGKGVIRLKGCSDTLTVSNRHMHLFRQM